MFVTGNRYLTLAEMQKNALYIWDYLKKRGWTLNAVAGMLGNMQTESTINPGIWQSLDEGDLNGGYGLTQWTPATKYLDWCYELGYEPSHMDSALERIGFEFDLGLQYYPTDTYPESFREFKESTKDPYYLGGAFLYNYERPRNPDADTRGKQAVYWYDFLIENGDPDTPTPTPTPRPKRKTMSLILKYFVTKR